MQFGTASTTASTRAKSASKRRGFDMHVLLLAIPAMFKSLIRPFAITACMFLLPFVSWFGIPSPFAAAALLASKERSSPFALLGFGLSLLLRLLWGLDADPWQYVGCMALWLIKLRCQPKSGIETAVLGGLAMMPRTFAALAGADPMSILLSCATVPIGMLSSASLRYGLEAIDTTGVPSRSRERASSMLLCLLLVSGLGYFRVFSLNLGQVSALLLTVAISVSSGTLYGVAAGLLCGLSMALGGHDCRIALSLAMCGLFCGFPFLLKRRWLCIPLAMLGNLLAFFITPLHTPTLSYWAVGIGSALFALLPMPVFEWVRNFSAVSPRATVTMENAFVTQRIAHMQEAVQRLAEALPKRTDLISNASTELGALLCERCANREQCWGRSRPRTERMLNALMELSESGASIDDAQLPILAEHGCLRADAIPATAHSALINRQKRRAAYTKAQFERELTLTHLAAMTGTLGELSVLAAGESFSDLQAAHVLNLAIDELRIPAKLCYARRVDGHLQAALEAESLLPIQKPLESLLRYLSANENMPLSIARAEKGHVELEEIPLYSAVIGTASLCAGQRADKDDPNVCGDTCVFKRCEGGRLLMMLSDGMGHGAAANQQSEKTLELLLLLLEAGYTRRQAITAVNGIMLSAQEDEQFSTVDLADVDLWTGDVFSEKLGACASWIVRGNHMKKMDTASLPLGIMEEAVPTAIQYRLHSGDILVLMSDGIADVFRDDEQMERVLSESLFIQPQRMADALIRNALLASDGTPKDDMSVMVMLLIDRQRGGE
ncbi:MAG: SpoIIE family protein phosphatase [Clostridia bacterium]